MDALRRAFRDIAAGHTIAKILGRPVYIKHLSHADHIGLEEKREEFHEYARSNGLPTEEQQLDHLRKSGQWSPDQDRELSTAESYIAELEEGRRKHGKMPSMVKSYAEKIEQAKKEWKEKRAHRQGLLGLTCEYYAERETNDHYVLTNIYADPELKTPFLSVDEYDYLPDSDHSEIVQRYNDATAIFNEQGLKKLAMQPFFQRYFQLAGDDLTAFFGLPICRLTFYQVDLLRWGAQFRHIYSSNDVAKFPPEVLTDPELLLDYVAAAEKTKQDLEKQGAYEQGAMVVGMKPEDAKATGVKNANPLRQITEQFGGNVLDWVAKQG